MYSSSSSLSPPPRTAGSLTGSASLPQLPGAAPHDYSPPSRAGLTERVSLLESRLSERQPKSRQRVFASHAHDTQLLQQMASVLAHRAANPPEKLRGISHSGIVEEGQLYAICLQQLAAQMAVHSPPLSELAGQLFHGFVGLFQRSVAHQELRLERERSLHEKTRVAQAEAESEASTCKQLKDEMERKMNTARRQLDDKDRQLSQMEKRVHELQSEVHRTRSQLEQHLGIGPGGSGGGGSRSKKNTERMLRSLNQPEQQQQQQQPQPQVPTSPNGTAAAGGGAAQDGQPPQSLDVSLEDEVVTHEEEVLEDAVKAMAAFGEDTGGGVVSLKKKKVKKVEDERTKNRRVVTEATENVQARVADIEAFLAQATEDAEMTGKAADYLQRFVRSVGAVDFGHREHLIDVETQVEEGDWGSEGAPAALAKAPRRRSTRRGSTDEDEDDPASIERLLRLSRLGKLKTESGMQRGLPPRIAARTVMQLMVDKATRGQAESLPNFLYSFYLHMYGVKKLAEANLTGLILSCKMNKDESPRLATFATICCMEEEPTSHQKADADLVCNMYAELATAVSQYNASLPGSPAVLAETRLPTGDDGSNFVCPVNACKATLKALFQHLHSLHAETFDDILKLTDELQESRKGKPVVDVDMLVARVLSKWQEGRASVREQVGGLFAAADVNSDGVLSYDEFTALVKIVLPSATEERIWRAFRECIERTPSSAITRRKSKEEAAAAPSSASAATAAANAASAAAIAALAPSSAATPPPPPPASSSGGLAFGGISPEVFLDTIENHGLLGANLSTESLASAQRSLAIFRGAPLAISFLRTAGGAIGTDKGDSPSGGGAGGGKGESGKGEKKPSIGGKGKSFEENMNDANTTLRMDLLLHEWRGARERLHGEVAALRESLKAIPKGSASSAVGVERESISTELESVPSQLERFATFMDEHGADEKRKGPPPLVSSEDAAYAWEQYRAVCLKLSRLPSRVEELANGTFAAAASPASSKTRARGAPGSGTKRPSITMG